MASGASNSLGSEATATGLGDGVPDFSPLFGGPLEWKSSDWIASDDRVRGGSSQSYLTPDDPPVTACFHGNLDTTTLGGAGFASQRTSTDTKVWNLSSASGIMIKLSEWDEKTYAFTLKDEIPKQYEDSKTQRLREEASVSWEHVFTPSIDSVKREAASGVLYGTVLVEWKDLKATYRGRERKDAEPLDLKNIRRMSLMMRSFFGKQEGDFSLKVLSIETVTFHKDAEERANGGPHRAEAQKMVDSETDSQGLDGTKVAMRDDAARSKWGRQVDQLKTLVCGCWRR